MPRKDKLQYNEYMRGRMRLYRGSMPGRLPGRPKRVRVDDTAQLDDTDCQLISFPITLYGYNYSKDNIETLLDAYGLLLFSTYNDDGGNAITGHLGTKTSITPSNRLKSVAIPKSKIKLVSGDGKVSGFIFDSRTEMQNALKNLTGSLQVTEVSPYIQSSLPRNNGNGKVSPGELVGIAFNLFNSSNTDMGDIQLLAND